MFVELRELLRSGAIRRHQFGSKRAIYSALLAAIFTLLHRFAIIFLVSSLYYEHLIFRIIRSAACRH